MCCEVRKRELFRLPSFLKRGIEENQRFVFSFQSTVSFRGRGKMQGGAVEEAARFSLVQGVFSSPVLKI